MRLYGYFRRLIEVATIAEKTVRGLIALSHSGGDQVLRGKLCDEGKEIYQKKCCRI